MRLPQALLAVALLQALLLAQDPADDRATGIALYRESKFGQALPTLQRAYERNSDDKEIVQLLGLTYYFLGQVQQAIPLLERVREWLPGANVDASYVLGVSYIRTRNFDKALKAFASMLDVPTNSAAAHLFLARMLLRQQYEPTAEEYVEKALALSPKLPLAHFLRGEIYLFSERIPEAIESLKRELEINPNYAPAYYKLGDAYARQSKWDEAQRQLQRSIWLDSTASGPYVLLGKVHLKKGEAELASRFLERAIQMDSNNFSAHQLLGQAYRLLGRNDDAERHLKRADELQKAGRQ